MATVTLDGAAGVGKSAVGEALAARRGQPFLSVGMLYRAHALAARRAVAAAAPARIEIAAEGGSEVRVRLDGEDVNARLYGDPELERETAALAARDATRREVTRLVREWVAGRDVVLEGRAASGLVPQAISFFLRASTEERASRTVADLARRGIAAAFEQVRTELDERDSADTRRRRAPLRLREDMIFFDSSGCPTVATAVERIASLVEHHEGTRPWTASVIVPVRNRRVELELQLPRLLRQTLARERFEVIVCDDGSTDGSAEVARAAGVQVVRSATAGAGAARNAGIEAATGDVIVFVDADMLVDPDFIRGHLEEHTRFGPLLLLGARRHLPVGATTPDAGWRRDSREAILDRYSYNAGTLAAPWSLAYSCNASMPRNLLELTGGFDEGFRGWGLEDLELALRCHHAGARFAYSRRLCGYHLFHDRTASAERYAAWRGNLRYFRSRHPDAQVARLERLAPVFDPLRLGDFVTLYDSFDGSGRPPQRMHRLQVGRRGGDRLLAVQRLASKGAVPFEVIDETEDGSIGHWVEAAAPGLGIRYFTARDAARLDEAVGAETQR